MDRAREKPGSWQSGFTGKEKKVNLLLSICCLVPRALQHICYCHAVSAYMAFCSSWRGYCSPPKAYVQQKSCSLRKQAKNQVLAFTTQAPSMLAAGWRGSWGRLKAHWKHGINNNTDSKHLSISVDSVTASSLILHSTKQLSPLLSSMVSVVPHCSVDEFCRFITYKR